MSSPENRRYPRIRHVSSREIVHLDAEQNPKRHVILTENFSASGLRFNTNEFFAPRQHVLIYLNDQRVRDINKSHSEWIRSGDYYLSRVVWVKPADNAFEVGVEFIEKHSCKPEDLDIFTELLNVRMLEKVNEQSPR